MESSGGCTHPPLGAMRSAWHEAVHTLPLLLQGFVEQDNRHERVQLDVADGESRAQVCREGVETRKRSVRQLALQTFRGKGNGVSRRDRFPLQQGLLGPDGSFQRVSGSGEVGRQALVQAGEALKAQLLLAGKQKSGSAERVALAAEYRAEKIRCLELAIAALNRGSQ